MLTTPISSSDTCAHIAPLFVSQEIQDADDARDHAVLHRLDAWNRDTELLVTAERDRITRRAALMQFDGEIRAPAIAPSLPQLIGAATLPSLPKPQSGHTPGYHNATPLEMSMQERAVRGACFAVGLAAAQEAMLIYNSPPAERAQAAAVAAKRIALAGGLAGLATPVMAKLGDLLGKVLESFVQSTVKCKSVAVASLLVSP